MRPEKRAGKYMILQLFNEMQTVGSAGLKKKKRYVGHNVHVRDDRGKSVLLRQQLSVASFLTEIIYY